MALRVLTLHLLSQLVIHVSLHVPPPHLRARTHARAAPRALTHIRGLIFFSSDTSVRDILHHGRGVQYLQDLGRGYRKHHRKIELEEARPNKMSAAAIHMQRLSLSLSGKIQSNCNHFICGIHYIGFFVFY